MISGIPTSYEAKFISGLITDRAVKLTRFPYILFRNMPVFFSRSYLRPRDCSISVGFPIIYKFIKSYNSESYEINC